MRPISKPSGGRTRNSRGGEKLVLVKKFMQKAGKSESDNRPLKTRGKNKEKE